MTTTTGNGSAAPPDSAAAATPDALLADAAPKRISILGVTGSIGQSTTDLVRRRPDAFAVEAVTAANNVADLARDARELGARCAVIANPDRFAELREALADTDIEVAAGAPAIVEAASRPVDLVMAAIVGSAGLESSLAAIRSGATLALANKETLVCAGELVMAELAKHGGRVLPVDSEHNAIFQVLDSRRPDTVDRIVLTASGGPFRTWSHRALAHVTPDQAVAHPNWSMGAKISVDSATMMNKGLELIEAHHLFGLPEDRIDILVHPQSIIHSMVTYCDGSVLAQLGTPDMRTPIAYSLAWPTRMSAPVAPLDLARIGQLTFEAPDSGRFPALALARQALQTGGTAPTILNAANEVAVEAFLAGRIGYPDIASTVAATLERATIKAVTTLADITAVDAEARETARDHITRRAA
jgi:1-deoxy-D-xylulose-5-phosphate reductoisomerase